MDAFLSTPLWLLKRWVEHTAIFVDQVIRRLSCTHGMGGSHAASSSRRVGCGTVVRFIRALNVVVEARRESLPSGDQAHNTMRVLEHHCARFRT